MRVQPNGNHHANGDTTVALNQRQNGGQWVNLVTDMDGNKLPLQVQGPASDRELLPETQTIQSACNPLRQTCPQLFSRRPSRRRLDLA